MNILVSINSKYRKQLEVLLYSLRLHSKSEKIDIYLINKSLLPEELSQIERYMRKKCNMSLHVVSVTDDTFWEQMPLGTLNFSVEMYLRILAPYILPENMERILWLDADIVVNGDISSFYYQDFEDKSMVVCMDDGWNSDTVNVFRRVEGRTGRVPYFNSGVLLMNLKNMRQQYSYEYILVFSNRMKDILFLPDQDILNMLYQDKVIYADEAIYNYQKRDSWIHKLEKTPYIIHYIGVNKPWMWGYIGPYAVPYWMIRLRQRHYVECALAFVMNYLIWIKRRIGRRMRGADTVNKSS